MSKRWRGCLLEIVETVLLTVIIFFLVQHFVAQPYQILQVSMEHTLEPGQYVLVDKITPVFSDYKRGDVIVFEPPTGYSEDGQDIPFIKRVIGVAGDLVAIHDDAVYVNGVKLDEPYVFDGQPTTPLSGQSAGVYLPASYSFWATTGRRRKTRGYSDRSRSRPSSDGPGCATGRWRSSA